MALVPSQVETTVTVLMTDRRGNPHVHARVPLGRLQLRGRRDVVLEGIADALEQAAEHLRAGLSGPR
jgi:hypothetical protein